MAVTQTHQIITSTDGWRIAVSCTCREGLPPLAVRPVFPPVDVIAVWRRHLAGGIGSAERMLQ